MTELQLNTSATQISAPVAKSCFACGAPMVEAWRTREKNGYYVWFECSNKQCTQTYLLRQHEPLE